MKSVLCLFAALVLPAQVTPPAANWPTYHGSDFSQHYSTLTQLNPANVAKLNLAWTHQAHSLEKFETTPLVIDGVMYLTEAPNTIVALDPVSGRPFWVYEHKLPDVTYPCCGKVNRGVAYANGLIYFATHDAKVLALDARTGRLRWENTLIDHRQGYSFTHAPLVVKDKVIVGSGGGELGIRGFLAALDAKTGKELWRFQIIPAPGEPGNETWGGDSWKHGGGSIWLTGSYDPELNLTYWGSGNPGPDWNPAVRPGDNLYSDSVLALDPDTGKLKWHFQFTPHDEWDWDAVQTPVLVDREWNGRPRKLMFWASRNGFFYVFDRATGEYLLGKEFVKQTWAKGLDERGRPMKIPGMGPSKQGTKTYPGVQGGTNWYAPAYSPRTGLFYLTAWDDYHGTYFAWDQKYEQGKWYAGGGVKAPVPPTRRERIVTRDTSDGYAAVRALDPLTGKIIWDYKMQDMSESGLLATATDLLFSGNREGHFFALDARTGKLLWRRYLGGQVIASPITYQANGKQYVSIAAGHTLFYLRSGIKAGYDGAMPTKAALSEEEYIRTSYSGVNREFRDGELLERSVPEYSHGTLQGELYSFFRPFRKDRKIFPSVETRIRLRPGRYVIPDVCVFWPDEPATEIPESLPLLVVEVLSPDDRMSDVIAKLREYHDAGVPHVWLADPKLRCLYLYRDGLHEVTTARLPEVDIELRLTDLFA